MDYYTIYSIVFCVLLIIFGGIALIFALIQNSNDSEKKNAQLEINKKAKEVLSQSKFCATKVFLLNDRITYNQNDSYKKFIAIDLENKKAAFVDYESGNTIIVNFQDILNYELYENGDTVTSGGNIYGLGVGVFNAETTGNCKELRLIIRLTDYAAPQVTYDIISHTLFNAGVNKSSTVYTSCLKSIQEVISFLEVIKHENESSQK
jgi:hypothetical protein